MAESVVPWEDSFVIGQGFKCPGCFPVNKLAMAFTNPPATWALKQLNSGASITGDASKSTNLDSMGFSWSVVDTYSDLAQSIAGSLSFGYKGFGYGVQASASGLSSTAVTSKSVIALMTAKFESDAYVLEEHPELSDYAKQILKDHDVGTFYDLFGTHFISGIRKGAEFSGIIEVRFSSEQDKKTFEMSAKASFAGEKASAAASFAAAVRNTSMNKEVRVKVDATGWKKGYSLGTVELEAQDLVTHAQAFANEHEGVSVAAVLRPFNTVPSFVVAAGPRLLEASLLTPTAEAMLARKLTLEAIKLDILDATLAEVLQRSYPQLQAAVGLLRSGKVQLTDKSGVPDLSVTSLDGLLGKLKYLKRKVEAAKLFLTETEKKSVLSELAEYIKSNAVEAKVEDKVEATGAATYNGIFVSDKIGASVMELAAAVSFALSGGKSDSSADVVALLTQRNAYVPVRLKNWHGRYLSRKPDTGGVDQADKVGTDGLETLYLIPDPEGTTLVRIAAIVKLGKPADPSNKVSPKWLFLQNEPNQVRFVEAKDTKSYAAIQWDMEMVTRPVTIREDDYVYDAFSGTKYAFRNRDVNQVLSQPLDKAKATNVESRVVTYELFDIELVARQAAPA